MGKKIESKYKQMIGQ